jgi:GTP cyclohydrolase II
MTMEPVVRAEVSARIPTQYGTFKLILFKSNQDDKEHLAFVMGDVEGKEDVLVRVHSECFTGDVMGSLRCDCGGQLRRAMARIAQAGQGVVLYLRQEGRGIGLADKLRAYNLQDEGYDTVEANVLLGHGPDERDFSLAVAMIKSLGIKSVRLLTNNPKKIKDLEDKGIRVTGREPLEVPPNPENALYLLTKKQKMNHYLSYYDFKGEEYQFYDLIEWFGKNARSYKRQGRPLVTLSYAQTLDGSITHRRGVAGLTISGPETKRMTHWLRAQHRAILVGIGTLLSDDPKLTVMHVEGEPPRPVILDSNLRTPLSAQIFNHPKPPIIVCLPESATSERASALRAAGAEILPIPPCEGKIDLTKLLPALEQRGLDSLMIEGGATVITAFLKQRLADIFILTIAPFFAGGVNALTEPLPSMPRLYQIGSTRVGQDIVLWGVFEPPQHTE